MNNYKLNDGISLDGTVYKNNNLTIILFVIIVLVFVLMYKHYGYNHEFIYGITGISAFTFAFARNVTSIQHLLENPLSTTCGVIIDGILIYCISMCMIGFLPKQLKIALPILLFASSIYYTI